MKVYFFAAEFIRTQDKPLQLERKGGKGHHFFEVKERVTPSVTAAGDTNLSDATAWDGDRLLPVRFNGEEWIAISVTLEADFNTIKLLVL